MAALSKVRESVADDTDAATAEPEPSTTSSGGSDPFSQDYDLSEWTLDAETVDQVLGILMVVTNLL